MQSPVSAGWCWLVCVGGLSSEGLACVSSWLDMCMLQGWVSICVGLFMSEARTTAIKSRHVCFIPPWFMEYCRLEKLALFDCYVSLKSFYQRLTQLLPLLRWQFLTQTLPPLHDHFYLNHRATGLLSVRIMCLSGISDDGAGSLVSQWGSTIKPHWVHTVTSQYDHRCC